MPAVSKNKVKYPVISHIENRSKNTCAKCGCGRVAKYRVTVQFNEFRGDDDVLWRCDFHKNQVHIYSA